MARAARQGVEVRPSRSSSDRTGNQAVEQGERREFDNVVDLIGHFANRRLTPRVQAILDLASLAI